MSTLDATIKVEVMLGQPPTSTSGTWTDVTQFVRHADGIKITRGRATERDDLTPGECTFTLDNTDRRFDPTHAAGPHFGTLTPRCPVRVTATHAAATYPLFRGYVDGGWPQKYATGLNTVSLRCLDAIGLAAQADGATRSSIAWLTSATQPKTYWQFRGDSPNATEVMSGKTAQSNARTPVDPIVSGGAHKALDFSQAAAPMVARDPALLVTEQRGSFECWVRFPQGQPTGASNAVYLLYGQFSDNWRLPISAAPTAIALGIFANRSPSGRVDQIQFFHSDFRDGVKQDIIAITDTNAWRNVDLADGRPHHISVRWIYTGSPSFATYWIVVDGVYAPVFVLGLGTVSPVRTATTVIVGGTNAATFEAQAQFHLDDMALWDNVIVFDSEMIPHQAAGATGGAGETLDQRAAWVTQSLVGWPLTSWAEASQVRAPAVSETVGALDQLRSIEASERGKVHVKADGTVTLLTRSHWATNTRSTTVQLRLADDGSGTRYRNDAVVAIDDRALINDMTITRLGGNPQRRVNAASVSAYGRRSASAGEILCTTDGQASDLADWIVAAYGQPTPRIETLSVQPQAVGAWPALLTLDVADLIEMVVTPAVGAPMTIKAHVEGLDHSITADDWTVTVRADAARVDRDYFRWGSSLWDGSQGWSF